MSSEEKTVRTRTPDPDLSLFPNLLYLGPQRTGSTWLHANLSRHPEVHLHRDKEIFYFSTLGRPQAPRYRFAYLEDYLDSFREGWGGHLLKSYHTLRRCGCFYRPRVRGDFTASYGVIDEGVIGQIVSFEPRMRGIILLRDPVERAWSHAKKDLMRGKEQPPNPDELARFIGSADQLARADYAAIIDRWRRYLVPGNLFVAPYSRISVDPELLLDDINSFLGIRQLGGASKRHISTRQNATSGEAMPQGLREEVEIILGPAVPSFRNLLAETGPYRVY